MVRRSRVVIVGASVAGLTTAEGLRAEGFDGEILLLGDEPHLPYGRPPLSKQVLLGEWEPERSIFKSRRELDDLGIEFRGSDPATGLDVRGRTIATASGPVRYDHAVIATGARARPVWAASGVRTLRTLDDAAAVGALLRRARRVAVLGAGVLGSEIASAGRALGVEVTLVGRSGSVTFGAVGGALSSRLEELHERYGVQLRLGAAVDGVAPEGDGMRVATARGAGVTADVVIAAVGGMPNIEWLAGSGLTIEDGVVCDDRGMAAPGVHAVGDVAAWSDPVSGTAVRVEHQSNAIEQAMAVAGAIVDDRASVAPVPFFWSEIHGTRIKAYGRFHAQRPLTVSGDVPSERPLLLASTADGRVTGIVAWDAPTPVFRAGRALVDLHSEERSHHV